MYMWLNALGYRAWYDKGRPSNEVNLQGMQDGVRKSV